MSDSSDSEVEKPQPTKKRKRLQDYLDEKAAREAFEAQRKPKGDDNEVSFPVINPLNFVKNKEIRSKRFKRQQGLRKKEDKLARKARKQEGGERSDGHTIESLREDDQTTVANLAESDNEEVKLDLDNDELSKYYTKSYEPKVLITYSCTPHTRTRMLGNELERIIPNALKHSRNKTAIKNLCPSAIREGFTDVIIINENNKEPEGMLLIHLPEGPTAHFKISNFKSLKDLRKHPRNITEHRPEVILTNFTTR